MRQIGAGYQVRSSVLGTRPSASDRLRCRVPGPGARYPVPDTWYLLDFALSKFVGGLLGDVGRYLPNKSDGVTG